MTDLVQRLLHAGYNKLEMEAADEIELLRAENERLLHECREKTALLQQKDGQLLDLETENEALRNHLDAALDVVIDLGGEVRVPEMEEARRLRVENEALRSKDRG
jgi:hypothetical protein